MPTRVCTYTHICTHTRSFTLMEGESLCSGLVFCCCSQIPPVPPGAQLRAPASCLQSCWALLGVWLVWPEVLHTGFQWDPSPAGSPGLETEVSGGLTSGRQWLLHAFPFTAHPQLLNLLRVTVSLSAEQVSGFAEEWGIGLHCIRWCQPR